jgi:hypothetical protein
VVQSNGTLPADGSLDTSHPVSFEIYAASSDGDDDFAGHAMRLRRETPVVVFSKVRSFSIYVFTRMLIASHRRRIARKPLLRSQISSRGLHVNHRYSKRAKELLNKYNLDPKPFIVELDLRRMSIPPLRVRLESSHLRS